MDPTQRCFSIEREGDLPFQIDFRHCLVNFKDEFMFHITAEGSYRYSLAEHKWEELSRIPIESLVIACSLGDKVYVLSPGSQTIKVLHNPDAPVSS